MTYNPYGVNVSERTYYREIGLKLRVTCKNNAQKIANKVHELVSYFLTFKVLFCFQCEITFVKCSTVTINELLLHV